METWSSIFSPRVLIFFVVSLISCDRASAQELPLSSQSVMVINSADFTYSPTGGIYFSTSYYSNGRGTVIFPLANTSTTFPNPKFDFDGTKISITDLPSGPDDQHGDSGGAGALLTMTSSVAKNYSHVSFTVSAPNTLPFSSTAGREVYVGVQVYSGFTPVTFGNGIWITSSSPTTVDLPIPDINDPNNYIVLFASSTIFGIPPAAFNFAVSDITFSGGSSAASVKIDSVRIGQTVFNPTLPGSNDISVVANKPFAAELSLSANVPSEYSSLTAKAELDVDDVKVGESLSAFKLGDIASGSKVFVYGSTSLTGQHNVKVKLVPQAPVSSGVFNTSNAPTADLLVTFYQSNLNILTGEIDGCAIS